MTVSEVATTADSRVADVVSCAARDPWQVDGELPYIVTCPPMETVLREDDCLFVLAQGGTPYNSWAQSLVV